MSEQEEYHLKDSKSKVGALYPVLLSKDGKVIDSGRRIILTLCSVSPQQSPHLSHSKRIFLGYTKSK